HTRFDCDWSSDVCSSDLEATIGSMPTLSGIVEYANEYLRVREIQDWPNALNGLQIENSGSVTKIGAAVDVSTRVLTAAAKKDVRSEERRVGKEWRCGE